MKERFNINKIDISIYDRTYWFKFALFYILIAIYGYALTQSFGSYIGKVIDIDTGDPIVGAVVVMECFTQTGNLAGSVMHYANTLEVLTDEKGEFTIDLREDTFRPGHFWIYCSRKKEEKKLTRRRMA